MTLCVRSIQHGTHAGTGAPMALLPIMRQLTINVAGMRALRITQQ